MCSLEWRDVELAIGGRVSDEIGKMQPILKTPGNDLFGLIRQGCDEVATILTSRSMQIKELIPFEPVWVNTDLLNGLGERLGFEDAEILVNAAMEELAELLYLTESLLGDSDSKRLRENVQRISDLSESVGMHVLAQIARDVAGLCDQDDKHALSATMARMRRVGERSLMAIWDAHQPVG